jgi:tetratricopeptide (TPR) repeat protein
MDRHELDALLNAIADAAERADGVMRLIPAAPSRSEADCIVREARGHLAGLRAILDRARQEEEVRRRTLLKALPMLAVSPAALERLGSAHLVDRGLVDAYDEALNAAATAYPTAAMPRLYGVLGPHVTRMGERLRGPMAEGVRLRLASLTAETALLAGWAAMVSGQHGRARDHYALADSAATFVRDDALRALALEGRSNLYSHAWTGGTARSQPALDALGQAVDVMPATMPSVARQWVLARYAQELGAARAPEHGRYLEAAQRIDPTDQQAGGIYRLDGFFYAGAQLADIEAFGLTVGDRPDDALALLNEELAAVPDNLPRRQANLLTYFASAHVEQGEPEQAARTATEALDLATGTGSSLTQQRVQSVYNRLGRWTGIPAVRELRERLIAAT